MYEEYSLSLWKFCQPSHALPWDCLLSDGSSPSQLEWRGLSAWERSTYSDQMAAMSAVWSE